MRNKSKSSILKNWSIERWKAFLDDFDRSDDLEHESIAVQVCQLATQAAEKGTYGVGAVLVDGNGEIRAQGHNEVYVNGFRSDLHAEMVVLNEFEKAYSLAHERGPLTLITSLEPCPMCMTRLIFAGIGTVLHVCPDDVGGMVQRKESLPPVFQRITEHRNQVWELASCSEELREAAFHIWDRSRRDLDAKLPGRKKRRNKKHP